MTKIDNDIFNIANRITEINPQYELYYNGELDRFEIHTAGQFPPDKYSMEFATNELDERILFRLRSHSVDNYELVTSEMDAHNEIINDRANKAMQSQLLTLKQMLNYAHQTNGDYRFTKQGRVI